MWSRWRPFALRPRVSFAVTPPTRRGLRTEWIKETEVGNMQTIKVYTDSGPLLFEIDLFDFHHGKNQALLVYLPANQLPDLKFRKKLSPFLRNLPFPTVRINYRFHRGYKNESAVRDALHGFDIVKKELCTETTKIAVYGRYIGAPLALSLGLCNSRPSAAGKVSAVAIDKGIYDWTVPATAPDARNYSWICGIKDRHEQLGALLAFNRTIQLMLCQFQTPTECFNPFASPALYFRSAGRDIPAELPVIVPEQNLGQIYMKDFMPVPMSPQERIRYPPKDSGLEIPLIRVSYVDEGHINLQATQSAEIAALLRESILKYSGALDAWTEAQNRIQLVEDTEPPYEEERRIFNPGKFNVDRDQAIRDWLIAALK